MPGLTTPVDRHHLHVLLYGRTDSRGAVRIHQRQLADELGVTKFTMCRYIRELVEAGRLEKIGAAKGNIGLYVVADPARFAS